MPTFSQSFQPVLGLEPRVLILGTLPGKESLRKQEYYGNPRNHFWKIIYTLFDAPLEEEYGAKIAFAKENKIALWDVCHRAVRASSLDSDIKEEQANEIGELLDKNPTIKTVAFNGQKAEKLFDKYFDRREEIKYLSLLSSSPANASYSYEKKLAQWRQLAD